MHPNVGPFIGKQLIQKLVTGDPTPQYISRVAAAVQQQRPGRARRHESGGQCHPDRSGSARCDQARSRYGKLREPVLFMAAAARALNTASDGVYFQQQSTQLGQRLSTRRRSSTYYPPTYVLPGTSALAPEFAIQNSSTAINRYNFANTLSFGAIAPLATCPARSAPSRDWTALSALAGDPMRCSTSSMCSYCTVRCLPRCGRRSCRRSTPSPATDPLTRAKTAFYLVVTSPQYQVER